MGNVKIVLALDGENRNRLECMHLADMAESEALEGRDAWMFLAGMLAMKAFSADEEWELVPQAMLTEKAYELAVEGAESEDGFKDRLAALGRAMCAFIDEKAGEGEDGDE